MEIGDIFPNQFTNILEFYQRFPNSGICLQWINITSEEIDFQTYVFAISIIEEKHRIPTKKLESFFNFVQFGIKTFLIAKTLQSRIRYKIANSEIIEKIRNIRNIRSAVDIIAKIISKATDAQLCLIYFLSENNNFGMDKEFYLGGADEDESQIPFAENKFSVNGRLGKITENDLKLLYEHDYLKGDNPNLKAYLETTYQIRSAELFMVPLHTMIELEDSNKANGSIVLFRENNNNIDKFEVAKFLFDIEKNISKVIETIKLQLIKDSAFATYNAGFSLLPVLVKDCSTSHELIENLQKYINQILRPALQPVGESICFAVFSFQDRSFKLVSERGFIKENIDHPLPNFDLHTGLTGSVIEKKNGEIFCPFVDDIKKYNNDLFTSKNCVTYWNKMIGSSKRFFYGKHLMVGIDHFVLVVIGKRVEGFDPTFSLQLIKEAMNNVTNEFVNIVRNYYTHNSKITKSSINEEYIKYQLEMLKLIATRNVIDSNIKKQLLQIFDNHQNNIELINSKEEISQSILQESLAGLFKNYKEDGVKFVESIAKTSNEIFFIDRGLKTVNSGVNLILDNLHIFK